LMIKYISKCCLFLIIIWTWSTVLYKAKEEHYMRKVQA
jgi:hypothetical protein